MSKQKILLLTLVHPDFLPPVYAFAQVLRDKGYQIDIITFDSYVPAPFDIGENISVISAGKYHIRSLTRKWQLRRKFISIVKKYADDAALIISFCPFSFLAGLKVNKAKPHIYVALELYDFIFRQLLTSPLTSVRNFLTLKKVHKASKIITPSIQRSAWLAGRAKLANMPDTIHNTPYHDPAAEKSNGQNDINHLVPENLRNQKTFLYTGRLNDMYCIKELLEAFSKFDKDAVLIITGIREEESYSKELLKLHATLPNKDRIILLSLVTRNDLIALQNYGDVGICFIREFNNDIEKQMAAPNKVGEYLAQGLYVLGNENPYMKQFQYSGVATLVKNITPSDILVALNIAFEETENMNTRNRVREFYRNEFCMQQQMASVINFLNHLKN